MLTPPPAAIAIVPEGAVAIAQVLPQDPAQAQAAASGSGSTASLALPASGRHVAWGMAGEASCRVAMHRHDEHSVEDLPAAAATHSHSNWQHRGRGSGRGSGSTSMMFCTTPSSRLLNRW